MPAARLRRPAVSLALFLAALCAFSTPAAAQTGWGIAVTRSGAILFCDRLRSTVWQVDPDGSRHMVFDAVTCNAVATGLDGEVVGEATPMVVTMATGLGVWRLTAAGQREWLQPPSLLPNPRVWVARDAQGRSILWNGVGAGSPVSSIVRQDAAGTREDLAGGARGKADGVGTSAAFDNVTGIAAAPDGSILAIDDGNIRRITASGVVRTEALGVVTDSHIGLVNAPGLWGREIGIASDPQSEAVVVDPAAERIVHIDRAGHARILWAPDGWWERFTRGRWGWHPSGVAMLGRTYYVADEWIGPALIADIIGSPRVMQVDDAGHVTRIASVPGWTVRIGGVLLLIVLVSLLFGRKNKK